MSEEEATPPAAKQKKKPLSDVSVWDVGKRIERELARLPTDQQRVLVNTLYVKHFGS